MEREAFENEEIAKIMNKHFISIKVDREERPDLDEIYMKAVQAMTGQGGWPLNVFLTPDLNPFYGGTYFPPEPKYGLPSFKQLLEFVSNIWRDKKGDVQSNAEQIMQAVKESYVHPPKGTPSASLLDGAYAALVSSFDPENGGFGGAPKFPLPNYSGFLLRYYLRAKKELALKSVTRTLEAMAGGGIHDQVGGGFHRYSTDKVWLVPHFEKMLYDNALLAKVYLEAYQVSKNPSFSETAVDILDWLLNEMRGRKGGFYSAQDADTVDGEGVYYTWKNDEVKEILGAEDAEIFSFRYGITRAGNFDGGRTILRRANSVETTASRFGLSSEEIGRRLAKGRRTLYQVRLKRPRPSVDDKILTSWNGLTISALAYAYQVLMEERYLDAAREAAEFLLKNLRKGGKLLRRFRDGEATIEGTLEDYAFLVQGLLDLYESTFDVGWLEEAIALNQEMVETLWDEENGGFFMNPPGEDVPVRIKEGYDGPIPSGNSVAVLNLLRISDLTDSAELKRKAEKLFQIFHEGLDSEPSAHTFMLAALDYYLGSAREIVIAADSMDERTQRMVHVFQSRFIPNKVMIFLSKENSSRLRKVAPLIEGKTPLRGKPTAYICENFACKNPLTDIDSIGAQLDLENHSALIQAPEGVENG
jgi:uncharacterized protein YyaL (SSP411 family)